jgi:hypothetical protein
MNRKGFTQIDYIVATGIFLVVFALVVQYINVFFSDVTAKTNVGVMTTEANNMLGIAERESPANMVGLMGNAYRLHIMVNNSRQAWKDQGKSWVNIGNEIVAFNYTDMGIAAAVNSTAIYDDSGNTVAYNINGNTISFNTSVAVNSTKNFTVFFDTDSNFTSGSVAVAGADNLSETIYPVQKIEIMQYRKMLQLNLSNYTMLKNITQTPRDFRITITDVFTSLVFFDYGPAPPPSGNVVAMQRFVAYQNSTAGIRRGALNVQVW